MGIFDFFMKQFLEVIQWTDDTPGILACRYPMEDKSIKNGAQLTVRETQLALFVNEGEIADLFEPGQYTLTTQTLPVLTSLLHWDKGFVSPFKSDVFFYSTREQIGQKWGTAAPISFKDVSLGLIQVRAHGTFCFKVHNPKVFFKKVSGTQETYTNLDFQSEARSLVVSAFSSYIVQNSDDFLKISGDRDELTKRIIGKVEPSFKKLGIKLTSFIIQSVSLPEEMQATLEEHNAKGVESTIQLERLKNMADKGLISEEDYSQKKAEILDRMTQ